MFARLRAAALGLAFVWLPDDQFSHGQKIVNLH